MLSAVIVSRIQAIRPPQYHVPMSTTGNRVTFLVCTSVSASNSSSMVPKPPGSTTNACAYLTNIVLRAKKYRKSMPRSTHSLMPCSKGSSMPSPTERPPASVAPLFAASITPGPPPVITAYPALASAAPSRSASSHSGLSGLLRADPNTLTARGRSASVSKPSTNSLRMRSARQASLVFQSARPRGSSSRWSAVLGGIASRGRVTGPR